jgi:hypothetical protein
MDPIVFIGNNPFTTNNIRSFKSPTYVASSLLDLPVVKKIEIAIGHTCVFFLLGS